MSEKILEINNLSVTYITDDATIYAANDFSLTINKGETVGLVGETGAGKTTVALSVLKLLPSRVGKITSGSINYGGIDIVNANEAQMRLLRGAKMSMIFQDPMTCLNPVLSIGDQIEEVLRTHKGNNLNKEEMSDRVDEMLQLVGLPPERKNEFPHQFSGGMKQRVDIAIALACEPELLLADEPTTALDVTIQAQVLALMNELRQKFQTSMILITHDLGVVAETCDKVAIMYAGEVIESGAVDDIFYGDSHHPYTTGLFGSIPSLNAGRKRLQPIPGLMPDPAIKIKGCPFAERCDKKADICFNEKPKCMSNGSHMIKCHLYSSYGEVKA